MALVINLVLIGVGVLPLWSLEIEMDPFQVESCFSSWKFLRLPLGLVPYLWIDGELMKDYYDGATDSGDVVRTETLKVEFFTLVSSGVREIENFLRLQALKIQQSLTGLTQSNGTCHSDILKCSHQLYPQIRRLQLAIEARISICLLHLLRKIEDSEHRISLMEFEIEENEAPPVKLIHQYAVTVRQLSGDVRAMFQRTGGCLRDRIENARQRRRTQERHLKERLSSCLAGQ